MKQLLCYGDSNTWGLIPGTSDRYPWEIRWTGLLEKKLIPLGVRVLEEGLCGRTTIYEDNRRANRNGLNGLSMILETHRPIDSAVIMLGTNDCKTCYALSAASIAKGMEQCLDRLLDDLPAKKILIVAPMELGSKIGNTEFDSEFDDRSYEVSLQLTDAYKSLSLRKGIPMLAARDYVHPSPIDQEHMDDYGHNVFANAVCSALRKNLIL